MDEIFDFIRQSVALPGFTVYLLTFAPMAIGQLVAGFSSKSAWAFPSVFIFPFCSIWMEGLGEKETKLVWGGAFVLFGLTLLAIVLAPSFDDYDAEAASYDQPRSNRKQR